MEYASNVQPKVIKAGSELTLSDHLDHFLARWGYRRNDHRASPGLYSLGAPTPESPVFVTANYRLSFDALRSSLAGMDCYILLLDTQGVNVWCAAGKGTFSTEELMNRIKATGLEHVVSHRKVILPQLGAPGVSAFRVKKESGWQVEYGPVRAEDLPEYLAAHKATKEMRRARFNLRDRVVLIPVEFVASFVLFAIVGVLLYLVAGWLAALAAIVALLAGTAVFPVLLPWLPTRDFTTKGLILGFIIMLPFAAYLYLGTGTLPARGLAILAYMLAWPPVIAFLAFGFTGSTPFTSRTGVRKELLGYIRFLAGTFVLGIIVSIILVAAQLLKVV